MPVYVLHLRVELGHEADAEPREHELAIARTLGYS